MPPMPICAPTSQEPKRVPGTRLIGVCGMITTNHQPPTRRCTIVPVKPPKTVFACQECGGQQPKWLGRCPDCGAWNSFVEEQPAPQAAPAAANHRYGQVSGGAS